MGTKRVGDDAFARVTSRRIVAGVALVWAGFGAAIGLEVWLPSVNADARVLGLALALGGPAAALAASALVSRCRDRLAGLCFIASAVTPTGFAYLFNLVALLIGLALVVAPRLVAGRAVRPVAAT